jgi:oligopeptide/dipeptide ABC transporter ATP-binding protein
LTTPVLEVKNLSTSFFTDDGEVKAVRDVSFEVYPGETLGIVGESGCGKSVTAMSLLGLVQRPGKVIGGQVMFKDRDLLKVSSEELRHVRGRDIAMIFQDPLSSLNPVLRVGFQIDEAMKAHHKIERQDIRARGIDLLNQVRVPDAAQRIRDYPHQFSGGMRQRAMIAMGLSNRPELLIADEPTTALDVTVQAQILELLRDLNQEMGTSIILITHNLGVVAGLCKRVIVMYAGEIVEEGTAEQIFEAPQHPYTWSLLRSLPRIDANRRERLRSIEGLPPDLIALPPGCKFSPRCPFRIERCFTDDPKLAAANGHVAACHVTMARAYAEMGAQDIIDTRPGAASGVHPPGYTPPVDTEPFLEAPAAEAGELVGPSD